MRMLQLEAFKCETRTDATFETPQFEEVRRLQLVDFINSTKLFFQKSLIVIELATESHALEKTNANSISYGSNSIFASKNRFRKAWAMSMRK